MRMVKVKAVHAQVFAEYPYAVDKKYEKDNSCNYVLTTKVSREFANRKNILHKCTSFSNFKAEWVRPARNYELRVKLWRALWQLIVYSEKQQSVLCILVYNDVFILRPAGHHFIPTHIHHTGTLNQLQKWDFFLFSFLRKTVKRALNCSTLLHYLC